MNLPAKGWCVISMLHRKKFGGIGSCSFISRKLSREGRGGTRLGHPTCTDEPRPNRLSPCTAVSSNCYIFRIHEWDCEHTLCCGLRSKPRLAFAGHVPR